MEHNIQFNFSARYFKSGQITSSTTDVWYVLHGYGQLAQYFLKKFDVLAEKNICVIAPEGMSRFYLENLETRVHGGGSNRVGASWMTRENRDMDIENYIGMLDAIHANETAHREISATILGFSQGAATATRWALHGNVSFKRMILWAGIFPPDMDFEVGHKIFTAKEVIAVMGKQDPFITPERVAEMSALSEKLGIKPRVVEYDGKHDIDEKTLVALDK